MTTLPEANSKFTPENRLIAPKRKGLSSNQHFEGDMLVLGGVVFF